jgi:hypothetical protein
MSSDLTSRALSAKRSAGDSSSLVGETPAKKRAKQAKSMTKQELQAELVAANERNTHLMQEQLEKASKKVVVDK